MPTTLEGIMRRATPHVQTNLRISVETYELIESLVPRYGTKAAVVTEAVQLLAQGGTSSKKDKAQEVETTAEGNRGGGVRPFGVNEEERRIVARMRTLKSEGASLQGIADALNIEGLRNRKGSEWTKGNVDSILRKQG